ncbi:hypothetical protein XA68_13552 [Ophiocordyceps unilateralis]|uniref:Uncharacterized protein n=1 Tax=Ophiocordyceps unilateralis TaxID=268505 RepID=A0A2A9PC21_OPHUN|nr:hypothetical protein XA68_13552 [Ophiocordyceps unilateralis]
MVTDQSNVSHHSFTPAPLVTQAPVVRTLHPYLHRLHAVYIHPHLCTYAPPCYLQMPRRRLLRFPRP